MLKIENNYDYSSNNFETEDFAVQYPRFGGVDITNKTDHDLYFAIVDTKFHEDFAESKLKEVDTSVDSEKGLTLKPHEMKLLGDPYNVYTFDLGDNGTKADILNCLPYLEHLARKFEDEVSNIREQLESVGALDSGLEDKFGNLVISDDLDVLLNDIKSAIGKDAQIKEEPDWPFDSLDEEKFKKDLEENGLF